MNILALVFSILMILSFGFYTAMEKDHLLRRIDKTFLGQSHAARKLLYKYENESFNAISLTKKVKKDTTTEKPKQKSAAKKPPKKAPEINPECARLNLWPLVEEGREEHQLLYEQLASLLRLFYKEHLFTHFSDKTGLEHYFLSTWIKSIKALDSEQPPVLEKIALTDPSLQMLYYKMLKGAKGRYPSLLDLVKISPITKEKICLHHANLDLLTLFFGDAAQAVYNELHGDHIIVTEEMIEEACRKGRYTTLDKELFTLLELSRSSHKKSLEKTLVGEDASTHISLRKKVYLRKS